MNIAFKLGNLHEDKFINLLKNIRQRPLQFITFYPLIKLKKCDEDVAINSIDRYCKTTEDARNIVCHFDLINLNISQHDFRRDFSRFLDILYQEELYIRLAMEEKKK